jgi:hypothetical protein
MVAESCKRTGSGFAAPVAGILAMPELRGIDAGYALGTSASVKRREIVANFGSVARSLVCLRSSAEVQGSGSD